MSVSKQKILDYIKGHDPKDRIQMTDLDDGETWTTTLFEYVKDNLEDDEEGVDEVLALRKGQKIRAGGGAATLFEIKRLDKKASTVGTTVLADHNIVLEGSPESRAYMAAMLPIALDWAHVHRVASFDSRVAKGDFCKDYKEFCRGNLGLPRTKMPQLRESVANKFSQSLAKLGIRVKRTRIPVDNLKATQKEINSDKAEGIAKATIEGKFDPTKDPVLVSREGHILDGHHRWAAALVATLKDGVKRAMNVIQIDLPIRELLQRAVNFDGVAFAGFDEGDAKSKKASGPTPFQSAKSVSGTPFRVSTVTVKSPIRGQGQVYAVYNQYGGVVGGSPDRDKAISMAKELAQSKKARFEEGVPADPTINMDPEDAAEWEDNTEKYKDKFKEASEFEASYFGDRTAKTPDPEVVSDAFERLEGALKHYKVLPSIDGGERRVSADEFMFMQVDRTYFQFKHRRTRNYLYLRIRDNAIVIPREDKPFYQGKYAAAGPQFTVEELMQMSASERQQLAKDKKVADAMVQAIYDDARASAVETANALKGKVDSVRAVTGLGGHASIQNLSLGGKGTYSYEIMIDTNPDLRTGKYVTTVAVVIGAGHDVKTFAKKTWSKRPSGKQVADWVLSITDKAADKVRKYWRL